MAKAYDVIVVGAGNGGLAAAATTAQKGLKTLLIERHNIPGGCGTSFRRGRFEFEASLHELSGVGAPDNPGSVRTLLNDLGVELNWVELNETFRAIVPGPDGYDVEMPVGRKAFIDKMESYVPGSRASMEKFFSLADEAKPALPVIAGGRADPAMLEKNHANFMRMASHTVDEVLTALGMPKKAQNILTSYWGYLGTPAGQLEFLIFALMVEGYTHHKPYIPKFRSHELSLAIEKKLRDYGGEVWYNSEVERILVKDGAVRGVMLRDGREVLTRHVISNIIPHAVFGNMIDPAEAPKFEIQRANARRLGVTLFTIYLGLNKSPEELGIRDYTVFLATTGDTNEQFKQYATIENNYKQVVNCLNAADPDISPPGTCSLFFTKAYLAEAWHNVGITDYRRLKNKVAGEMIAQYEQMVGVRISDCIEEIVVAGPPTFARYINTPDGIVYAYFNQLWDALAPRVMTIGEEQSRGIKGLRFCGGHSFRGHGYSSAFLSGAAMGNFTVQDCRQEG
jgi:prolycopene isomerase